uniref:Structural maintenance of chromosomes protein 5 n=1 Tax=Ditylenchus dipsaci TaxID=166011 RepID=A0A915D5D4_9BILA
MKLEETKELVKAEKELLEAQRQKNPLESKIAKIKESRAKSESVISKAKHEQSQQSSKINQLLDSLSLGDRMAENAQEFNRVQRSFAEWDEEIAKTAAEKKTFMDLLARARSEVVHNPAFEQNTQQLNDVKKNVEKLERDWKTQIEQLHVRKNALVPNNAWRFRSAVFVPLLHMSVPSEENMRLLNNIIGIRDMGMFIFGCKEDEDLLLNSIKPRRVNTTIINRDMLAEFDGRRQLPEDMVRMGFGELACNLFDAPLPVRAHLCSCSMLDRIPIGGQKVDDNSEAIGQQIGRQYGVFLTNKCRVSVVFSKYNGQVSTKRSELRPNGPICEIHACKALDVDDEERKLQEAADMNNQQRIAYEEEKDRFEDLYRHHCAEKANKVMMLEDTLSRINARLEDSVAQKPNINAARAAFEERKKLLAKEAIMNLAKLATQINSHRLATRGFLFASTETSYFARKLTELEGQLENLQTSTSDIQAARDESRKSNEKLKREVSEFKKSLLDMINSEESRQKVTIDGLRATLEENEIPTDIDLIESQIAEERGRLDIGRCDGTQKDVEELAKKQKRLAREKISANYSRFFTGLGCQGEVRLEIPEDKYNISQYGITIYVKFRNETTLQPLTHQVQSGGERSVSTMLYLMALQDLCPVPFRCVDEINQGMDPENERKVFNMMVQLLSSGGQLSKTQYFLLTPKLLGGLEFNERVTVHIVHNGPALSNVEYWDPEKFLRSR